jgi:hypothetical protein
MLAVDWEEEKGGVEQKRGKIRRGKKEGDGGKRRKRK